MPNDPRRRRSARSAAAAAQEPTEAAEAAASMDVDQANAPAVASSAVGAAPTTAASSNGNKPVLFLGGEDAMEVDEAVDTTVKQHQQQQNQQQRGPLHDNTAGGLAAVNAGSQFHDSMTILNSSAVASVLISRIITPSPYAHHNAGPSSARFRNAFTRVTQNPDTDTEAWQALMTEVQNCYRQLAGTAASSSAAAVAAAAASGGANLLHAPDADTHNKLDWVESCYGALLTHFPTAASYWVSVVELLLAQSARVGEIDGPSLDYGRGISRRAQLCEQKAEAILRICLGVDMLFDNDKDKNPNEDDEEDLFGGDDDDDNNNNNDDVKKEEKNEKDEQSKDPKDSPVRGICAWSVELWLLYVRKVARDATRRAQADYSQSSQEKAKAIRTATKSAYDTAVAVVGFGFNNHLLWKEYVNFVKTWVDPNAAGRDGEDHAAPDHAAAQEQMVALRSVYQRAVVQPQQGLDQLWQEYETFERTQSEALATALTADLEPKYQHARSIHLERHRVYSVQELQLHRLATPPVHEERETKKRKSEDDPGDEAQKVREEYQLLCQWNRRCSYERTNPERLQPNQLAARIRMAYKEMSCVFTRHLEPWHMWGMWELSPTATSISVAVDHTKHKNTNSPSSGDWSKVDRALAVLSLGQTYLPDCTLLAHAAAQTVERHTNRPSECRAVLERFLERSPNTLGFVLYQQLVRKYAGIEAAREVFARARRVLVTSHRGGENTANNAGKADNAADAEPTEGDDDAVAGGDRVASMKNKAKIEAEKKRSRWMVTNRLDPSIGAPAPVSEGKQNINEDPVISDSTVNRNTTISEKAVGGPITWHLYAAHAQIEHRLNRQPAVAARVYELGLRKHASFLTQPPYVMRYAQLLLERGDATNLRALLTRAVAACQDRSDSAESGADTESTPAAQQQPLNARQRENLATLWDMTLHFESILSGADPFSVGTLEKIERQRREALMGADVEDVSSGGFLGSAAGAGDNPLIGAQKSSIAEHLIRAEGYNTSSGIVNGIGRDVDVLEVMGLWGDGESEITRFRRHVLSQEQDGMVEMSSGGKSDMSYQRRLLCQTRSAAGLFSPGTVVGADAGVVGALGMAAGANKMMSARERLQQNTSVGGGPGQSTAIMLAIQQSPEWIRPLLLLLPASRMRFPMVPKPPPHLVELALSTLKVNSLPAERPDDAPSSAVGGGAGGLNGKRKSSGQEGDSSDEDDGVSGGGYGNQFRSRQRARMSSASGMADQ